MAERLKPVVLGKPDSSGDSGGLGGQRTYAQMLEDTHNNLITDHERLDFAITAMVKHLALQSGTISRPPHIVINPEGLALLVQKLTTESARERLSRNQARNQSVDDQVAFLVGGVLYTTHKVPKERAYIAAQQLLEHLFLPKDAEVEETNLESEKYLLDSELLDRGMRLTYITEDGSIAEQLEDQFTLVRNGLIVTQDHVERSFELPQILLQTLQALKHPESAEILERWLYEKLSGQEPHLCISYLRTLTEFTLFLDSQDYFQLYASGDEISLLPFHSLYEAVDKATNYLKTVQGYENAIKDLSKIRDLILSRFYEIILGTQKDKTRLSSPRALQPVVDDLVLSFREWVIPKVELGDLPPQIAANTAINLLRQFRLDDQIRDFADLLATVDDSKDNGNGYLEDQLRNEILREAIRTNAIQDPEGDTLQELMVETYRDLVAAPWKDLADHDLSKIITPDTSRIQIFYATGTFGFWTNTGHGDFRDKIEAYMDYLDNLDKSQGQTGTQRILVFAPLTRTDVPGYKKRFADVGTLAERVGSIIIQNPKTDRSRVFITTRLQPLPTVAGNILASINHVQSEISAKLLRDMKAVRRLVPDVQVIPCYGLDELGWKEHNGEFLLAPRSQQNMKFQKAGSCLMVGRHGHLIRTIKNYSSILELTDADFVLTPGSPYTSSTEAIRQLQLTHNTPMVQATALPFILTHWGEDAIRKRESGGVREPKNVMSVGEINQRVVKEYRHFLVSRGINVD